MLSIFLPTYLVLRRHQLQQDSGKQSLFYKGSDGRGTSTWFSKQFWGEGFAIFLSSVTTQQQETNISLAVLQDTAAQIKNLESATHNMFSNNNT